LEGRARTTLVAVVVVVVVAIPLAALFAFGGGGGDDADDAARAPAQRTADLRLAQSTTTGGLLVLLRPAVNTPQRAGGARSVTLRCEDAEGRLVIAQDEAWPFSGTDPLARGPHTHISLPGNVIAQVRSCRLIGTEPQLRGTLR